MLVSVLKPADMFTAHSGVLPHDLLLASRSGRTLQSKIVGKSLRETPPTGRGKLRRAISVPIFNNFAPLSTPGPPYTWPVLSPAAKGQVLPALEPPTWW